MVEFGIEHIAHHDIEISVLCVVQIVQFSYLHEFQPFFEFVYIAGFGINYFRFGQHPFQKLNCGFGALTCGDKLSLDKIAAFFFRQRRASRKSVKFLFADKLLVSELTP